MHGWPIRVAGRTPVIYLKDCFIRPRFTAILNGENVFRGYDVWRWSPGAESTNFYDISQMLKRVFLEEAVVFRLRVKGYGQPLAMWTRTTLKMASFTLIFLFLWGRWSIHHCVETSEKLWRPQFSQWFWFVWNFPGTCVCLLSGCQGLTVFAFFQTEGWSPEAPPAGLTVKGLCWFVVCHHILLIRELLWPTPWV